MLIANKTRINKYINELVKKFDEFKTYKLTAITVLRKKIIHLWKDFKE